MIKIIAAALILLFLVNMVACSGNSDTAGVPVVGQPAPDFQFKTPNGEDMSLSDLKGKPVLINFWATYCGSCCYEMPILQEIYEDPEWSERGLLIITINLNESKTTVQRFMEENDYSFMVLLDMSGKVGMLYNARYIPMTYFIDKDGIIKYIKSGPFQNKAEIEQKLLNLAM